MSDNKAAAYRCLRACFPEMIGTDVQEKLLCMYLEGFSEALDMAEEHNKGLNFKLIDSRKWYRDC